MAILSLILAVFALFCCVYLWLELQKKPSREDIAPALLHASEELNRTYEKSQRAIETEWADMYQKFQRIVGRADKLRGLEAPPTQAEEPRPLSRTEILRRHRRF